MATHTWTGGAGDGNFGTAANWDGGAPAGAADIIINDGADDIIAGMAQGAVTPASLYVGAGFKGSIGTPASPLVLGATTLMRVSCRRASQLCFNLSATEAYVSDTPGSAYGMYLAGGTWATLGVSRAARLRVGAAATVTTLITGYVTDILGDVNLTLDSGATMTTMHVEGGIIKSNAALGTVYQYAGRIQQLGDTTGAVTALHQSGGVFDLDCGAFTVTAAHIHHGACFDASKDTRAKTITALTVYPGGFADCDNGVETITITTAKNYGGVLRHYGTVSTKMTPPSTGTTAPGRAVYS